MLGKVILSQLSSNLQLTSFQFTSGIAALVHNPSVAHVYNIPIILIPALSRPKRIACQVHCGIIVSPPFAPEPVVVARIAVIHYAEARFDNFLDAARAAALRGNARTQCEDEHIARKALQELTQ